MTGKVIVAGTICMDIAAVVAKHPAVGEQVLSRELGFFMGGKGANQAIAAARLGAKAVLVGRIGKDAFGTDLEGQIKKEGVDVTCLKKTGESRTGTTLIFVEKNGSNTMVCNFAANDLFTPADLSALKIGKGDVCLSMLEIPFETVEAFFEKAREKGALTILTAAPCKPCPPSILELSDVVIANEKEFGYHSKNPNALQDIAKNARKLIKTQRQAIVVTLGANGAVAVTKEKEIIVKGRKVNAVDTTGAGDCFTAAFGVKMSQGSDLKEALEYANAAASISVQRKGAGNSMPTKEEVEKVLAEN